MIILASVDCYEICTHFDHKLFKVHLPTIEKYNNITDNFVHSAAKNYHPFGAMIMMLNYINLYLNIKHLFHLPLD